MAELLREGFVVNDRCAFTFFPSVVLLQGTIACLDDITLEVEKEIAVLKGRGMTALVQTQMFRYHAWVRGAHNIFRYESAHEHRPRAHKHVYDTFGDGLEIEVLDLLDEERIPTLGEVVRELQVWHQNHARQIKELR